MEKDPSLCVQELCDEHEKKSETRLDYVRPGIVEEIEFSTYSMGCLWSPSCNPQVQWPLGLS